MWAGGQRWHAGGRADCGKSSTLPARSHLYTTQRLLTRRIRFGMNDKSRLYKEWAGRLWPGIAAKGKMMVQHDLFDRLRRP
jgi:hypothetical protein